MRNSKNLLIEIETYRWLEHRGPNCDDDLSYRPKRELESWKKFDPLSAMEKSILLQEDDDGKEKLTYLNKILKNEIDEAFLFAESSITCFRK